MSGCYEYTESYEYSYDDCYRPRHHRRRHHRECGWDYDYSYCR
jgi:hypothetical protein